MIEWLESHPVTTSLVMWGLVLVAAWLAGGFRWIRMKTRKPRLRIVGPASMVLVQCFRELEGKRDVVRASFLISAEVINPSADVAVVQTFHLKCRTLRPFHRFGPYSGVASLPSPPIKVMGAGKKMLPVWFSRYEDAPEFLTTHGRVEPKEFGTGYLLVVVSTWGAWNPQVNNGMIEVRLRARLTSGDKPVAKAFIRVADALEEFEALVPGIGDQIAHGSACNIPC